MRKALIALGLVSDNGKLRIPGLDGGRDFSKKGLYLQIVCIRAVQNHTALCSGKNEDCVPVWTRVCVGFQRKAHGFSDEAHATLTELTISACIRGSRPWFLSFTARFFPQATVLCRTAGPTIIILCDT